MALLGLSDFEAFLFFFFVIMFFIVGSTVSYLLMVRWRFPLKISIYEHDTADNLIQTGKDRARRIAFGDAGTELLFLRKRKKYRSAYGHNIGKNHIAFAVGKDGYWYNIKFQGLNVKLMEVGVVPANVNIRTTTDAVRKGIDHQYQQKTFYEKWAVPITLGILIIGMVVQGAVIWYNLDKQAEVSGKSITAIETANKVSETSERTVQTLNQILIRLGELNRGSGIIPEEQVG